MSWDVQPDEPATKPVTGIISGVVVMLLAALFAFAGTGAGHGWMVPFMVTLVLFPIWPIGFWLPFRRPRPIGWKDGVAAALVLPGAAFALWGLFYDEFVEWSSSSYREVGLPWFGIALFGGALFGGLAWSIRSGRFLMFLPILLLGVGLLVDLGLFWQVLYGAGPWGYRGHPPDNLWFFAWAAWQPMVLWALMREWHRYKQAEQFDLASGFE